MRSAEFYHRGLKPGIDKIYHSLIPQATTMSIIKMRVLPVLAAISVISSLHAQTTDTVPGTLPFKDSVLQTELGSVRAAKKPFPIRQLVAPTLMVMYGFGGLESNGIKRINRELKDEVHFANTKKVKIDNYLIFGPAVAVYGLNALGIKGKHNFRDRTMLYVMSNLFMSGIVFSVKNISGELRPDASDRLSFPSGHTAAAFVSAEFMRQEYRDVSPWYGVAGYAMATATGYLRMHNNKHWFSDVVAGAGIGIASTKLAYWLYPKIQNKLFKDRPMKTVIMPAYTNGGFGLGLVHKF